MAQSSLTKRSFVAPSIESIERRMLHDELPLLPQQLRTLAWQLHGEIEGGEFTSASPEARATLRGLHMALDRIAARTERELAVRAQLEAERADRWWTRLGVTLAHPFARDAMLAFGSVGVLVLAMRLLP